MEDPVRIRLVFKERHLLTKSQRSEALKRCWCLVTPGIATIADLASHISRSFALHRSCPDGILLFMDDFVLPSFELSSIIKDKDIISVRKKVVKLRKDVNIEDHEAIQIHDHEILDKQPIVCGHQLLAIKEFQEGLQGYDSKDEEDADDYPEEAIPMETPIGVKINSKRKKCSNEQLSSRRKKLKKSSFEELVDAVVGADGIHLEQDEVFSKQKGSSSKNRHKKSKVPFGDSGSDGMIAPQVGANDKNMSGLVRTEERRKKLKPTCFKEFIDASVRVDGIQLEKDEDFSVKRGSCQNHNKKSRIPLGDSASNGMITPQVGTSDKKTTSSGTSEERHNHVEGKVEINGHEALSGGVGKFPSRSTRRKKARRKWRQELANSEKLEVPVKDFQITSSENQGKDQMNEEDLMPHNTEPQNMEQTTDVDEVIPIVVRPGHIRFEPVDAEHSKQQSNGKMETINWNGITNKKKGQKWGREKTLWRNGYNDEVSTMEANEINDEVSVDDQIEFETLMPLTSQPKEGDVIAYRLVELSSSWSPELSSFRVGKVSSYDPITKSVILQPVPNFPIFPGEEKEEESLWQPNGSLYKEDGSLEIDYVSLMDVRVFKPNKQLDLPNTKHGRMSEATTYTGDLEAVFANNNINRPMDLPVPGKSPDNVWEEIRQAFNEKKGQLLKKDGSSGSSGSSGSKKASHGPWSYRAVRGAALGPTIALLRAENDL
ncbi:hypothetical protein J5N97_020435 [Dioscorea zingiberensis]|uniref:Coilin n=1 Tax=Dioscorea zingiberensis TaxID=325984 RepID=A0A9D5CFV0_9LILI|nr:hypothetical protein J5N97_020435 [Dioscorea zingiberensis]